MLEVDRIWIKGDLISLKRDCIVSFLPSVLSDNSVNKLLPILTQTLERKLPSSDGFVNKW